jgi:hypothetical protein
MHLPYMTQNSLNSDMFRHNQAIYDYNLACNLLCRNMSQESEYRITYCNRI